ncbi:MAG: esterase/lipase family protein [Bacteroidales bacterium]
MARIIIGIHGLGNKPDKDTLSKWWQLSLKEGLANQGFETELPEFKMVYWADILYPHPLDKNVEDPENPSYIDEKYTKGNSYSERRSYRIRKRLLRYVGKQLYKIFLNEDLTIKYSFIPDYIIRKYFSDLEIYYEDECETVDPVKCRKKELIKQRLADVLDEHKNDKILLIAHSMGSIIAFDVLSFFAPEYKVHTFITIGSPLGIPLVVSKIASQYKNKPRGKKEMVTPPGIYENWFNFSDLLDKITLNYKLSRRYKFNENAIKPRDFNVANDYISEAGEHNPHKSYGYLRTKEFSYMLNNFIER